MDAASPKPSFSRGQRWLIWFNTILGVVAVLALVSMANYLASGYFKRFQASANTRSELAPQTVALLQRLTNKVEVTIFFDRHSNEEIYGLTDALLKQYSYANPNITVETLDYIRSAGKAASLLSKYKLTTLKDKNFVVFDSGERSKVVYGNELYDYDLNSFIADQSQPVRRESFKGELLFSSAIFSLTNPRQTKAYFVYGHGEHDPDNDSQPHGYAKFAAILKDETNVDWEKLSLLGTNEIPADCQLLIIAGPSRTQFLENELAKIETYLKQGRRLLVMLNNTANGNNSGIETILAKWNVGVANYVIEDKAHSPTGDDLTPTLNPSHPILKSIVAAELSLYFVLPRTVFKTTSTTPAADAPQVEILATTSTNAIGTLKSRNAVGQIETRQSQGQFPIMAAVEHGSIKNVNTATRILVVGDSLCFDDELINTAANHDFANSAINWLVDRPQMLLAGLGARPIKEYKLVLTSTQMRKLQWILLAAMPGSVLLLGGLVWLRRRS